MKAKAWQEVKSLSAAELEVKLRESEEKLFRVKFRHASTPVKNALDIRTTRRMIAQLKTLIRAKQLAEQKQ